MGQGLQRVPGRELARLLASRGTSGEVQGPLLSFPCLLGQLS